MKSNHFNWLKKPRGRVFVACSGGVDSVALALALRQTEEVTLAFFDHGNALARHEEAFIDDFARKYNFKVVKGRSDGVIPPGMSKEAFWRAERYAWFKTLPGPVATGHTLDDAVEWYLFTCMHGEGRFMPHRHDNVVRPFLLTEKEKLIAFCERHDVTWFEDPTNQDADFAARNHIRHKILPEVMTINPGIFKVVKNKIAKKEQESAPIC